MLKMFRGSRTEGSACSSAETEMGRSASDNAGARILSSHTRISRKVILVGVVAVFCGKSVVPIACNNVDGRALRMQTQGRTDAGGFLQLGARQFLTAGPGVVQPSGFTGPSMGMGMGGAQMGMGGAQMGMTQLGMSGGQTGMTQLGMGGLGGGAPMGMGGGAPMGMGGGMAQLGMGGSQTGMAQLGMGGGQTGMAQLGMGGSAPMGMGGGQAAVKDNWLFQQSSQQVMPFQSQATMIDHTKGTGTPVQLRRQLFPYVYDSESEIFPSEHYEALPDTSSPNGGMGYTAGPIVDAPRVIEIRRAIMQFIKTAYQNKRKALEKMPARGSVTTLELHTAPTGMKTPALASLRIGKFDHQLGYGTARMISHGWAPQMKESFEEWTMGMQHLPYINPQNRQNRQTTRKISMLDNLLETAPTQLMPKCLGGGASLTPETFGTMQLHLREDLVCFYYEKKPTQGEEKRLKIQMIRAIFGRGELDVLSIQGAQHRCEARTPWKLVGLHGKLFEGRIPDELQYAFESFKREPSVSRQRPPTAALKRKPGSMHEYDLPPRKSSDDAMQNWCSLKKLPFFPASIALPFTEFQLYPEEVFKISCGDGFLPEGTKVRNRGGSVIRHCEGEKWIVPVREKPKATNV